MMLENIENSFTSPDYNTTNIDKGKDEIIEYEEMTITLTTTENQKNGLNNNMTYIDLGKCETKLREVYNLSLNEKIYIRKIDVKQEGMKIPKILYDVYSKLNGTNLIKLNLSYCEDIKIDLSIPFILNDNIDKLNSSSGYYNDICYTTTSDDV